MTHNQHALKAVAYSRVSTLLNQDPANQLTHIRQFASAREFVLVEEFVDRGVSGSKERRPALDEMIKQARLGRFKIIIVSGIDRLARDTRHLLNLIHELTGYGVAIISLRENIDFSSPIGKAALTILGAIAELERQLIRERIRSALAAKKLNALKTGIPWRCGRKPIAEGAMGSQVHDRKSQGVSIRKIAKQVGIAKSTVQRILSVPMNLKKTG